MTTTTTATSRRRRRGRRRRRRGQSEVAGVQAELAQKETELQGQRCVQAELEARLSARAAELRELRQEVETLSRELQWERLVSEEAKGRERRLAERLEFNRVFGGGAAAPPPPPCPLPSSPQPGASSEERPRSPERGPPHEGPVMEAFRLAHAAAARGPLETSEAASFEDLADV